MKNLIFLIISLFLTTLTTFSQSLSVFDIDTTSFPIMNAKLYAFDKNGLQLKNLEPSDFKLNENDEARKILDVTCPESKAIPISSVLTIDVSGSMLGTNHLLAIEAANAWIDALPLDQSECCITAFNDYNYYIQDFTQNRTQLKNSLNRIVPEGGTNYDAGLIEYAAGGILAAKNGKNKRILVFLTDGFPSYTPDYQYIIQQAIDNDIIVYCVTLGMYCPVELRQLSNQTGGEWFENVTTVQQAKSVYQKIAFLTQDIKPCTIEWESGYTCTSLDYKLDISCIINSSIFSDTYLQSIHALSLVRIEPSGVLFQDKEAGKSHDTTITATAIGTGFTISNIIISDPSFQVTPSSFSLNPGESKTLTLRFTPPDSNKHYCKFELETDRCEKSFFALGIHKAKLIQEPTLELTHPNGGELFIAGTDTIITWEGVLPSEPVNLSYSFDNGKTWKTIAEKVTGLKYNWKNIPLPASTECLVRVNTIGDVDSKPAELEWQKSYGSESNDYGLALIQNENDKIFVTGTSFSGTGDRTQSLGSSDIWTIELNKQGDLLSEKSSGTDKSDLGRAICPTLEGGYILAASSSGFTTGTDKWDIYIEKNDFDGTIEWKKNYGGIKDEHAKSILQTKDGGYIIGGRKDTIYEDISKDYLAIKLDIGGLVQWEKFYGGSGDDICTNVIQTKDGGYLLAGQSSSRDYDISEYFGWHSNIWLLKLNSKGEKLWDKTYGGSKEDSFISIVENSDGTFALVGYAESTDGNLNCKTKGTFVVLKLDQDGEKIWQQDFIGTSDEKSGSIAALKDGGYIIACAASSYMGSSAGFKKDDDYLIIRLDDEGRERWHLVLGGSETDVPSKIIQSNDGGFLVAGSSDSYDGDITRFVGDNDYWIVKIWAEDAPPQKDISDANFTIVAPEISAQIVNMGDVLVGSSRDSVITDFFRSKGNYPSRIDSIKIHDNDARNFQTFSSLPALLAQSSNNSHSAEFRFSPDKEGPLSSMIYIYTQTEVLKYEIYGVGFSKNLEVYSDLIDFGMIEIAEHKDTSKILISNISDKDIYITDSYIFGPDKEQFHIIEGGGAFNLAANSERELKIRFEPYFVGRTSSQVAFSYQGVGSPLKARLLGTGIGGYIRFGSDSAYAGEKRIFNILFKGVNLSEFATLVDSFKILFKVEKTLLAPTDPSAIYKITDDSTYIEFSGPLGTENNIIANIELIAGLGRVPSTTIDIVEIKWFNQGEEVEYGSEYKSGLFTLLGICDQGGSRLLNPEGKITLDIMPIPVGDELKVVLNLIEKGNSALVISNSMGEEIYRKTISGQAKNHEIKIDLGNLHQGVYFISLQTPTTRIDKSFVRVK
jgi:von Willebrand factor type A domain-containing protein/type IX secretion system substrate protein